MKSSNSVMVPESKEAMKRFKEQAASEVGVSLKQGYNGDLTSKQAGSIGGQMVKNVGPVRSFFFERRDRTEAGHARRYTYRVELTV